MNFVSLIHFVLSVADIFLSNVYALFYLALFIYLLYIL